MYHSCIVRPRPLARTPPTNLLEIGHTGDVRKGELASTTPDMEISPPIRAYKRPSRLCVAKKFGLPANTLLTLSLQTTGVRISLVMN